MPSAEQQNATPCAWSQRSRSPILFAGVLGQAGDQVVRAAAVSPMGDAHPLERGTASALPRWAVGDVGVRLRRSHLVDDQSDVVRLK